jgi:hypothetical protein
MNRLAGASFLVPVPHQPGGRAYRHMRLRPSAETNLS